MVKIYCDGASKGNPGKASLGVWATDADGDGNAGVAVFEISKPLGIATNNVAEWQSLLHALRKAKDLGIQNVQVFMDSELVVFQVKGKYKVKKPEFKPFWEEVQSLKRGFQEFSIHHVRREQNKKADGLANQAI